MSDDKELDISKVSRVEAYYSHGMSWDIDAICKKFKLDKTKHIESLCVGKWAELHIFLNNEGLRAIKGIEWTKHFSAEHEWKEILVNKCLTYPGDEWTDDCKWPMSAKYFNKNLDVLEEETF